MPRDPAARARQHLVPWSATDEDGTSWVKLPSRQRLLKLSERDVEALEALLPSMRRPATGSHVEAAMAAERAAIQQRITAAIEETQAFAWRRLQSLGIL